MHWEKCLTCIEYVSRLDCYKYCERCRRDPNGEFNKSIMDRICLMDEIDNMYEYLYEEEYEE